jgi:caa(3)-type oxidase subunit IV
MTEAKPNRDRRYIVLWGVLVLALLASLVLGALGSSGAVVAIVFAVAVAKAYLVAAHFMHLSHEPRFVKLVIVGALAVIVILYLGLVPDIVWAESQAGGS